VDTKLIEILACPVCKGKLQYDKPKQELICRVDRLAFPIRDQVPILIQQQARIMPLEDL
jgi:uncharacterized protein